MLSLLGVLYSGTEIIISDGSNDCFGTHANNTLGIAVLVGEVASSGRSLTPSKLAP